MVGNPAELVGVIREYAPADSVEFLVIMPATREVFIEKRIAGMYVRTYIVTWGTYWERFSIPD